jgi:hypothetical protein
MVSIAAFQAVDPGSIPGHHSLFYRQTIITFRQSKYSPNLAF